MYNLARVELAMRGGLFDNPYFTSAFQIMYPWAYDAVHWPFLAAGWGCALPSFLCSLGTCAIVFLMLRKWYAEEAAWVGVTALLGLTCFVYQATSTKNDIPVVFCIAVWVYSCARHRETGKQVHLVWSVLAIALMAGTKLTGVAFAAILCAWTCWSIRRSKKMILGFLSGLVVALLVLASIETYVESARVFGSPLGPAPVVRLHGNSHGFAGGVANVTRFMAGSVYVGPTDIKDIDDRTKALTALERSLLSATGLTNLGLKPPFKDSELLYLQTGFEELSGFGPLGTLAMALMVASCFIWRPHAAWWMLGIGGFGVLLIVSFTTGYTEWSNRYVISSYAMSAVALVCILWGNNRRSHRWSRAPFAALAILSAIAAPFLSFNRGPSALKSALFDRERFEMCAMPTLGKVREHLRELRRKQPRSRVFYVVHDGSPVLAILQDRALDAIVITRPEYDFILRNHRLVPGDFVIEDAHTGCPGLNPIALISAPAVFSVVPGSEKWQIIYQVEGSPTGGSSDSG